MHSVTLFRKSQRGFTLVEIMIVVAIIGLLAAIAIPGFARARQTSWQRACVNNLRQVDSAKQQWALESGSVADARPAQTDLVPYLRSSNFPTCPAGGTYRIRRVSRIPVCDQPNHDLDFPDGLPD